MEPELNVRFTVLSNRKKMMNSLLEVPVAPSTLRLVTNFVTNIDAASSLRVFFCKLLVARFYIQISPQDESFAFKTEIFGQLLAYIAMKFFHEL